MQFKHPNIVEVFDRGEHGGHHLVSARHCALFCGVLERIVESACRSPCCAPGFARSARYAAATNVAPSARASSMNSVRTMGGGAVTADCAGDAAGPEVAPRRFVHGAHSRRSRRLLEHGSVQLACRRCGHEMLVAFSCKRRGFCPSCLGRRMSDIAARLVDEVLPEVPIRQWSARCHGSCATRLRTAAPRFARLEAGVMEDGAIRETLAGTPQGGVISPLLANIYLNAFDRVWQTECSHLGELVRYCDDFVVMCRRESAAREALERARKILARLGLELHPDKTRLVDLRRGRESFDFLGCTFRKRRSIQRAPHLHFMQRWPSPHAMKRIRRRIHDLTDVRRTRASDVMEIIAALNPVLRGWSNYFRTGNADAKFNQLDDYVHERIQRWLWRRGGQRTRFRLSKWPHERLYAMGLYRLRTRVRYPAKATPQRPSVSRVRENRTHGLNGGLDSAFRVRVEEG